MKIYFVGIFGLKNVPFLEQWNSDSSMVFFKIMCSIIVLHCIIIDKDFLI